MEGVILFADDKLLDYQVGENSSSSDENKLFRLLAEKNAVLGLKNRKQVEDSINSIGTFTALILDWQFDLEDKIADEEEDESIKLVQIPSQLENRTYDLLMNNNFYSLVCIYSSAKEDIEEKFGTELRNKYKDRILFRDKSNLAATAKEAEEIISSIEKWKASNQKISLPIKWSQSINQAVQSIFSELNTIDSNWVKELYDTAKNDGVTPSVEVLNLFQNILSEKIIQDKSLREKIDSIAAGEEEFTPNQKYAELIRILYYGKCTTDDPIMTGDVFQIDKQKYGIIITPECDIRHISGERSFEMLCFSQGDYKKGNYKLQGNIKASPIISKAEEFKGNFTKNQKVEISQQLKAQIKEAEFRLQLGAFTQTNHPRLHILPCFQFTDEDFSGIALIDFRSGLDLVPCKTLSIDKRVGKLNTPYIQELRQRYLSYKGRVGVPGYSIKLREWLLSHN